MKKILLVSTALIILLVSLSACASTTGDIVLAASEKPRDTEPDSASSSLNSQVEGNNQFAFEIYQQLINGEDDNLFYSPYSISVALAMTYAGARGETAQQMRDTLHFDIPDDELHAAFNALDLALASRGEGAEGKDDQGFRLNPVNAVWGQQGYHFLDEFLDTLAVNYGAGLRLVDFIGKTEESRLTINDWVSEQTEQRIKDLLGRGDITVMTRLVLTNAIYFNAAWLYPFEEELTEDGSFYLLDGGTVTVPMMRQSEHLGYSQGDGYQAVELPYDGNELSMVILLPDAGQYTTFEASLDAPLVDSIIDDISRGKEVALTMPKFTVETRYKLGDILSRMGMPDAFTQGVADLSGMDGSRQLYIGKVIHQAFVDVDEAGTEAAAATAVIVELTAMPEFVEVTIDRPFIFLIRDIETDTTLFIGRILNPAG